MTGMRYSTIVFMQGDEGHAARDILDEQGFDALFDHLLQWDYGEDGETYDSPPWVGATTHYVREAHFTYVVAYDRIGSMSLNREWWETEPTVQQINDWRYAVANGDTTLGLEDWADQEARSDD